MIFRNPAGAPELACNECGCRWFDRQKNACYECGEPPPEEEVRAFRQALADFQMSRSGTGATAPGRKQTGTQEHTR